MKWNKSECRPVATQIYTVIKNGRITIPHGKQVTAKHLCGKWWNTLTAGERRFAGRFISAAVRTGFLGLEQVRRDGANAWRYRRKQSAQQGKRTLH